MKVHRCLWSGEYPENSLSAIIECYRARVARAEIDFHMLRDGDFLVTHDATLGRDTNGSGAVSELSRREATGLRLRWRGRVSEHRPPLLSDVVDAIRAEPYPTVLELDMQDFDPWPWPRVEELARLLQPVRDRVVVAGCADWNLRRLAQVDPSVPRGFNPQYYFDWVPREERPDPLPGTRGAYGYLDTHPLARVRRWPTADYLRDRLGAIIPLVPGAREAHLRLTLFERMLDDGLPDVAELFHAAGQLVDVWTLNAGFPGSHQRLERAIAAGADMVTTDTAAAFAAPLATAPTEGRRTQR